MIRTNRRRFLTTATGAFGLGLVSLGPRGQSATPQGFFGSSPTGLALEHPMSSTTITEVAAQENAVRPFHVNIAEEALVDLRRRIAATHWPEPELVPDESQGVQLAALQEIARYWATDYDWRNCEAKLNALPQFMTEIDGVDIYFIHVRSKHENALPLIVTHGYPGSPLEQLKIIDPLTNPTAYGASASDAFHVVIPAVPGYGFSGKATTTGWGPDRTARAWTTLMKRLGYTGFVAQGGDIGAVITNHLAQQAPPELLGMHTNFPYVIPPEIGKALALSQPPSPSFSADEKRAYEQLKNFNTKHAAYAFMMRTRPQTLYGLVDSPIGLAAWMLDHGDGYSQPAPVMMSALLGRTIEGHPADGLTRDDVLDNITMYWLTHSGVSMARFYFEIKGNATNVNVPAAVSVFPGEIYQIPKSWTETVFHKLIYYSINKIQKGGHFAAWEQPQVFAEEVRAGLRPLRK